MDRRTFMRSGAAGTLGAAASAGLAAPALAQAAPTVSWRCLSAFPPSSETIHGGAVALAQAVREASDGAFDIQILPPDEIAAALDVADAVTAGRAEMCHTASQYSTAIDPTYALGSGIPFGLNTRGMQAWLHGGDGLGLLNGFFGTRGLQYLPGGATGAQMGGWFRREIRSVEDLSGLRMRIAGLAGRIVARLGVVPSQLAGGEIYPALESGAIDAAEWIGPDDDEKLGFVKVAPYYHYPGWWEGGLALNFFINKERYDALPPSYRGLLQIAARSATIGMLADHDFRNPPALKRLVAAGAQLRPYPQAVLNACFDAAGEVYAEIAAENPAFETIHRSMMAFRNEAFLYNQVAEYTYDTFMMIKQREGALGTRP